jgi:hypothetical protein
MRGPRRQLAVSASAARGHMCSQQNGYTAPGARAGAQPGTGRACCASVRLGSGGGLARARFPSAALGSVAVAAVPAHEGRGGSAAARTGRDAAPARRRQRAQRQQQQQRRRRRQARWRAASARCASGARRSVVGGCGDAVPRTAARARAAPRSSLVRAAAGRVAAARCGRQDARGRAGERRGTRAPPRGSHPTAGGVPPRRRHRTARGRCFGSRCGVSAATAAAAPRLAPRSAPRAARAGACRSGRRRPCGAACARSRADAQHDVSTPARAGRWTTRGCTRRRRAASRTATAAKHHRRGARRALLPRVQRPCGRHGHARACAAPRRSRAAPNICRARRHVCGQHTL